MFRTVLPRATPRAALRAAGPKAIPSTFITPPMVFIGRSKRGYASDAGELLSGRLLWNG
jgi:dihydrolipoamide dehydrogenase